MVANLACRRTWIPVATCLLLSCSATAWIVLTAGPGHAAQRSAPVVRSQLVWFDRAGKRIEPLGSLADHLGLELSPDGKQVAVAILDPTQGTHDLWLYEVPGGRRTRFTSDPADENWLIWSPDGRRVIFNSFGPERLELHQSPSSEARTEAVLLGDAEGKWPLSWSPDGQFILVVKNSVETSNDVWVLPLSGDRKPYPFLQTIEAENWAAFSPDGKWVAYSSTQTGQAEVYVTPFPARGRQWRVSRDGGSQARWRRDGKEIFYLAPNRTLMAAAINAQGSDFSVGAVEPLFEFRFPYGQYHAFDVSADGQRFLLNRLIVSPGGAAVAALH
jgi:dipeptidyl aminopeptidase/acylaminoacyl peptidase